MATIKFSIAFLSSFASFFLLLQSNPIALTELSKTGFTFDLIPHDSVHSPLYPGNLTVVERIRRSVQLSESHLLSIQSSITSKQGTGIRPIVGHVASTYLVRVGIGGNPEVEPLATVYLLLDTGSDVTWTQIKPCDPCFSQEEPIYRPRDSQTYSPISPSHRLCSNFRNGQCTYLIRYADRTFTSGILASDRLAFASTRGGIKTLTLVFGCSNSSSVEIFSSPKIGGVFGMGRGLESIASQLVPYTGSNRFAYCMVNVLSYEISYLRFGRDIVLKRNVQSTPFSKRPDLDITQRLYYVTLLDISVNRRRLNLPRGTFDIHVDERGGCIIDSGTVISWLIRPAYDAVRKVLKDYFDGHGLSTVSGRDLNLDLCYHSPSGFNEFPTMDLHFEGGATFRLAPPNLFFHDRGREINRFCLYMLPTDTITIIGAVQQQNQQMVFDVDKERLYFAAGNCDNS